MRISSRERNHLLQVQSRLRSSPVAAYGILVLILAFGLKLFFLDAVQVKQDLQAPTQPLGADVDASLSPDANTTINPDTPTEYWDHNTFSIAWGVLENYQMLNKLGTLQSNLLT